MPKALRTHLVHQSEQGQENFIMGQREPWLWDVSEAVVDHCSDVPPTPCVCMIENFPLVCVSHSLFLGSYMCTLYRTWESEGHEYGRLPEDFSFNIVKTIPSCLGTSCVSKKRFWNFKIWDSIFNKMIKTMNCMSLFNLDGPMLTDLGFSVSWMLQ